MVAPALYIPTKGSLSCLQYPSTVTYVEHKKNPIHTVTKYFSNFNFIVNFMTYKYFRLKRVQYSQECTMVPILWLFYVPSISWIIHFTCVLLLKFHLSFRAPKTECYFLMRAPTYLTGELVFSIGQLTLWEVQVYTPNIEWSHGTPHKF
jgi:hypothetical protein